MPKIEFKNITKKFGKVLALDNVSLEINDGEYVALLGPSGCGKTTLLKTLAGILIPSEGSVLVDNKDITALAPEERHIGMVFQNYALFPHMNVLQNTVYGPLVRGEEFASAEKTAHDMLELVRLAARYDALPSELSGGMQQRVALARALTTGSKILLLDEPLSALDAKIRAELRLEMRRMAKELGLTAIHVTHDQEEATMIADRIVVMRNGRIEQVGTPEEVYTSPVSLFVAGFIGEANFFTCRGEGGGCAVSDALSKKITIGAKSAAAGGEAGASERCIAVVRPEAVGLRKGGSGKIISRRLVGGYHRYEIELGTELVIAKSLELFDGNVSVDFDEKDARLFPYPREGLKRALEIE